MVLIRLVEKTNEMVSHEGIVSHHVSECDQNRLCIRFAIIMSMLPWLRPRSCVQLTTWHTETKHVIIKHIYLW